MATGHKSPRWTVVICDDPFPHGFYNEGQARQFVQNNKANVTAIIMEHLKAQFDSYAVWEHTNIDPKSW